MNEQKKKPKTHTTLKETLKLVGEAVVQVRISESESESKTELESKWEYEYEYVI